MGANNLPAATDGNVIPPTDHNALVEALLENLVPRNASRNVTSEAGSLGTSIYKWLRAYVKEYYVGTPGNNLKIYEGADSELWLERSSADNEIIKLRNGSLEVWLESFKILTLTTSNFSAPDKYISHDVLKTSSKIKVGNVAIKTDGDDYLEIFSETLTGCIAGKKIITDLVYTVENISGTVDLILKVNGTAVVTSGDYGPFNRYIHSYTVPSDGDYTISIELRDFVATRPGGYRIEEV